MTGSITDYTMPRTGDLSVIECDNNRPVRSTVDSAAHRDGTPGEPGIGFASLSEIIDTTIAGGTPIFQFVGALEEVDRPLILERVTAGIAAERKRGKHVSRPRKLSLEQVAHARDANDSGDRAG